MQRVGIPLRLYHSGWHRDRTLLISCTESERSRRAGPTYGRSPYPPATTSPRRVLSPLLPRARRRGSGPAAPRRTACAGGAAQHDDAVGRRREVAAAGAAVCRRRPCALCRELRDVGARSACSGGSRRRGRDRAGTRRRRGSGTCARRSRRSAGSGAVVARLGAQTAQRRPTGPRVPQARQAISVTARVHGAVAGARPRVGHRRQHTSGRSTARRRARVPVARAPPPRRRRCRRCRRRGRRRRCRGRRRRGARRGAGGARSSQRRNRVPRATSHMVPSTWRASAGSRCCTCRRIVSSSTSAGRAPSTSPAMRLSSRSGISARSGKISPSSWSMWSASFSLRSWSAATVAPSQRPRAAAASSAAAAPSTSATSSMAPPPRGSPRPPRAGRERGEDDVVLRRRVAREPRRTRGSAGAAPRAPRRRSPAPPPGPASPRTWPPARAASPGGGA